MLNDIGAKKSVYVSENETTLSESDATKDIVNSNLRLHCITHLSYPAGIPVPARLFMAKLLSYCVEYAEPSLLADSMAEVHILTSILSVVAAGFDFNTNCRLVVL